MASVDNDAVVDAEESEEDAEESEEGVEAEIDRLSQEIERMKANHVDPVSRELLTLKKQWGVKQLKQAELLELKRIKAEQLSAVECGHLARWTVALSVDDKDCLLCSETIPDPERYMSPMTYHYYDCCGQVACLSCARSWAQNRGNDSCPFCRSPPLQENAGMEQIRARAEAGSWASQRRLIEGLVGKGIDRDMEQCVHWLRLAAEQGDSDALTSLGALYEDGNSEAGIAKSPSKAEEFLTAAAKRGCAVGQYRMGMLSRHARDYERAFSWFTLSAAQGYSESEYHLGGHYLGGGDAPLQSLLKAIFWFKRAAQSGHAQSQAILSKLTPIVEDEFGIHGFSCGDAASSFQLRELEESLFGRLVVTVRCLPEAIHVFSGVPGVEPSRTVGKRVNGRIGR